MMAIFRFTGIYILGLLFLFCETSELERGQYKVRTLAFYNVENLFDTINDSLIYDDDRTPLGKDKWTQTRYEKKIEDLSLVLSGIGKDITGSSPDIIGLCEVENQDVVEDLIHHSHLAQMNYGIIHMDSPDERGIDVAMLYKKGAFLPISFASHRLVIFDTKQERNYTRDQLVVGGILDSQLIHFIVNHWPSRSGGEARSRAGRISAARLNRRIIDSIHKLHPLSKLVSMGDLNDNPLDDSLKKVLLTKAQKDSLKSNELFNPMESLYKKGIGTLAYRDEWSLFDQILISGNMTGRINTEYTFWKVGVYNPSFLITQSGRYKGYPYRTYAGGYYAGGYSDHFPVYVAILKQVK